MRSIKNATLSTPFLTRVHLVLPPKYPIQLPRRQSQLNFTMAPAKSKTSAKDMYSVILPTFNERQNLPIITWLLNRTFTQQ